MRFEADYMPLDHTLAPIPAKIPAEAALASQCAGESLVDSLPAVGRIDATAEWTLD